MTTIQIPNNWKPRWYQQGLWNYMEGGGKRGVAVCHRRWGKDDLALHWTAYSAHKHIGTYWHMLPEYAQARKAIWTAVNPHTGLRRIDEAFPPEIRKRTDEQSMFIEFLCGSTWQVVGSDSFNSLVGAPPIGLVFSEWALANPAAWAYLRPILLENGGWSLFIYTSRGKNHGYKTWQLSQQSDEWYGTRQTALETGVFTSEQLENERLEYINDYGQEDGEALFQQEYYCSFDAAVIGAYYARLMAMLEQQGKITSVPYDPTYPVATGWDLGIDDATAVWFAQVVGNEVRIIDYLEARGRALTDVAKDVLGKPYVYSDHYLPHDVATRELTTARTRKETLEGVKLSPIRAGSKLPVADGINAVRNLLPRCVFDAEKCERGLNALREYKVDYDTKLMTPKKTPLHNWASHCFTGDTEILTLNGKRQIQHLNQSGKVLTPCGWKEYRNPRVTRRNAPLVEVAFEDGLTVRCTPDHMFLTVNGWKSAQSLNQNSLIQSCSIPSRSISMVDYIDCIQRKNIWHEAVENCIERSGKQLSGISRPGIISIIETIIRRTISYQTSNAWKLASTFRILGRKAMQIGKSIFQKTLVLKLLLGTDRKLAGFGIADMPHAHGHGQNGNVNQSRVKVAATSSWRWFAKVGILKNTAQNSAKPKRIISVKWLNETADVWCLTVPEAECFALSNGAVVHNCADAFRELAVQLIDWKGRQEHRRTNSQVISYDVFDLDRNDLNRRDPADDWAREDVHRQLTSGTEYDPFRG